ncbi:hypothetical protein D3C86_1784010 [compost metagenome]
MSQGRINCGKPGTTCLPPSPRCCNSGAGSMKVPRSVRSKYSCSMAPRTSSGGRIAKTVPVPLPASSRASTDRWKPRRDSIGCALRYR